MSPRRAIVALSIVGLAAALAIIAAAGFEALARMVE